MDQDPNRDELLTEGPALSRTALEHSQSCPYRYQQLHIVGLREHSEPAERGRVFHDAAHAYGRLLWQAKASHDYDQGRIALRTSLIRNNTPVNLHREITLLFNKWMRGFVLDLAAYLLSEELLVFKRLRYRPDLVYAFESVLEVHDFKTWYVGMTEVQARREFQTRFYLALASVIYPGFPRYRMVYHFVRVGTSVTVDFTPPQLESVLDEIRSAVLAEHQMRERDDFPARPGQHCGFCQLECPEIDHLQRAPMRVRDEAEAKQLAGETLPLQKGLRERRKALKAWAASHGVLHVNGMDFANWRQSMQRFRLGDVLAILYKHGVVDVEDIELTRGEIDRWLDDPRIGPELDQVGYSRDRWVFRAKKGGVMEPQEDETDD